MGLQLATDGEFRRSWWHFDFFWHLTGCERVVLDHGIQFHGVQTKPESLKVTGKLDFPADHPMLDALQVPEGQHQARAEDDDPVAGGHALPRRPQGDQPSRPIRTWTPTSTTWPSSTARPSRPSTTPGCRYLQLDDTVWAYLCSKEQLAEARARGEDADKLAGIYAKIINTALKSKPADMTITTHVCRGNFRSTWISEGGYEPVAEQLLGGIDYDGYFLEYDTRAGRRARAAALPAQGQEARGRRPRHLQERHAREEGRHQAAPRRGVQVRPARPAVPLSPQCGFASTEEGNVLTEEQQWAKLAMIVDISKEVWR